MREHEDVLELTYSIPAKLAIITAVPMFAGLGAFFIWFTFSYWAGEHVTPALFGLIGLWFLYMSLLAARLTRYLNVRVIIYSDRIEVRNRGEARALAWSEIGKVRHDGLNHVLTVRDRSGQLFLMVDTDRTGFAGLDASLAKQA